MVGYLSKSPFKIMTEVNSSKKTFYILSTSVDCSERSSSVVSHNTINKGIYDM